MKPEKIHTYIESAQPRLSPDERASLWRTLETHLPVAHPIPSPYLFIFSSHKIMTAFLIALLIIASGGGTVYASDAARPGDFLFPLDRTLENTRLRLALSDDARTSFEKSITEERLRELREIIDEEVHIAPSDTFDETTTFEDAASGTPPALAIEVRVFNDTTVIKIESGNRKFYFEAPAAKTMDDAVTATRQKFPTLTNEQIAQALIFEREDRESRPKDRGIATFSPRGHERVDAAVTEILSFLDETADLDETHRKALLSVIDNEARDTFEVKRDGDSMRIGNGNSRFEINVDDDGDSRLDVRSDEGRVRIEQKNGEVRVQTQTKETTETPMRTEDEKKINTSQIGDTENNKRVFEDNEDDLWEDEDKGENDDGAGARGGGRNYERDEDEKDSSDDN